MSVPEVQDILNEMTAKNSKRRKGPSTGSDLQNLADAVGEFIEYWGFKRVHGRIWTHLFLSEAPLDAGQLIERLGISKALASMTLKDLLRYDVILPAGRSERGTDLFRANPDTLGVVLNVLKQREKAMLEQVRTSLSQLRQHQKSESEKTACPERLDSLGAMVQNAQDFLETILAFQGLAPKGWGSLTSSFTLPRTGDR